MNDLSAMLWMDTHCHLNFREDFPNPEDTLAKAQENGVIAFVVVGCDTETSRIAVELADSFEKVYASVGWHPNYSAHYKKSELKKIEELSRHPKTIAIGEIGFDYYRTYATHEQQRTCLLDHLHLALEKDLPVVFHCREAYDDLLTEIEKLEAQPCAKVLHCYSGNLEQAKRAPTLDCNFGVDGPITYKNAETLRRIVSQIPLERILLETDSPYLAPHPYRGKKNEPAMLPLIGTALAETLHLEIMKVAEITTANANRVFKRLEG